MGLKLSIFVKGFYSTIENLLANYDIDMLATPPRWRNTSARRWKRFAPYPPELAHRIPLIGFAGAVHLRRYAVEGGGPKNYARVKALMYGELAAWKG